jgi:hypothetical protein
VRRQRITARSTQRLQTFAPVTTQRPVAADPERRQHAVDLVGERQPLSREGRRPSSSTSLGIGTIEHTRGSSRSHASVVRSNISTSSASVFARRARRSTGTLDGWIT